MPLIGKIVIGIHTGQFSHSGIGLYPYKILIVVHFKGCLIGIGYTPYQYGTDHDRISQFVVDFKSLTIEVAGAQRNFFLGVQGIYPKKTITLYGTNVLAK